MVRTRAVAVTAHATRSRARFDGARHAVAPRLRAERARARAARRGARGGEARAHLCCRRQVAIIEGPVGGGGGGNDGGASPAAARAASATACLAWPFPPTAHAFSIDANNSPSILPPAYGAEGRPRRLDGDLR